MTLIELQEVLGERIKLAQDENMTPDQRVVETNVSHTIATLAKQMINNADVVLRAEKLITEGKLANTCIEKMIGTSDNDE